MSFDRTTLLSGPGKLGISTSNFFSEGDITASKIIDRFDVDSSAFGVLARRNRSKRIEIDFVPKMWNDLTKLFPYATAQIGDRICGASDVAMVATPRNGDPLTIANVAVMQMPSLFPGGTKGLLGAMKWVGLVANSADPKLDASYFAYAGSPAANVALTGFDLTKVPNGKYTATWNGITLPYKADSAQIDFSLGLEPDLPDGESIVNYMITALDATARLTPVGLTEAQYKALFGDDTKPIGGDPIVSDLVFTGSITGMPIITIKNCICGPAKVQYGKTAPRSGEVQFQSIRTVTAGALSALWTFGTV